MEKKEDENVILLSALSSFHVSFVHYNILCSDGDDEAFQSRKTERVKKAGRRCECSYGCIVKKCLSNTLMGSIAYVRTTRPRPGESEEVYAARLEASRLAMHNFK